MSIHKKSEGVFEIRWRQGGRHKSLLVHGHELARKVEPPLAKSAETNQSE